MYEIRPPHIGGYLSFDSTLDGAIDTKCGIGPLAADDFVRKQNSSSVMKILKESDPDFLSTGSGHSWNKRLQQFRPHCFSVAFSVTYKMDHMTLCLKCVPFKEKERLHNQGTTSDSEAMK